MEQWVQILPLFNPVIFSTDYEFVSILSFSGGYSQTALKGKIWDYFIFYYFALSTLFEIYIYAWLLHNTILRRQLQFSGNIK